jgi:hypothetical protein
MKNAGKVYSHLVCIFCSQLLYFVVIIPRFGMLHQEKSSNPVVHFISTSFLDFVFKKVVFL